MKKSIRKNLLILSTCTAAFLCSLSVLTSCTDPSKPDGGNETKVIPPDIEFTISEKTLTIGDEEYLFPVYQKTQGYSLSYQSSNPAIVEVNEDGKISAQSEGSVKISAIYSNGTTTAKADITVNSSFSGYLPELKTLGVQDSLAITKISSFMMSPYVFFNGKTFNDVAVSYEILNDSIAEITAEGEIVAKSKGKTDIIVEAAWRGRDKTNSPTMQKLISLSVIDDVRFFNGGESIADQAIYTLSEFEGQTYKNAIPCNFTVNVNDDEAAADVVIEDETILKQEGNLLVANGFGETKVSVQRTIGDETYSKDFTVSVERIEKTVTDTVPLFNTIDGTFLNLTTDSQETLLDFIDVTDMAIDAEQKGRALRLEDGKVFGVESSSPSSRGTAELSVGTATVIYHFNLETLAKAIHTQSDLKALELSDGKILTGYYELLNDIDATGFMLNHSAMNKACFSGVFNGNGHVISNLTVRDGTWNSNAMLDSSLFGTLNATAIVKNFALTNLDATKSYFLARETLEYGLNISNVYIQLSESTVTPRGLTSRMDTNAVFKNIVIEYLGENAQSNRNYEDRWNWQGLMGGMWRRDVDGKILAQDTKWNDVIVVSPFVVSFRSDENINNETTAVYGYGANETVDIYGNSLETSYHTRPNPNLGQYWWTENYLAVQYTNLYHYSDYAALASGGYDYSSFNSQFWTVYNNRVVWKSLVSDYVDVKIFDGNTEITVDTPIKNTGKTLSVKAYFDGTEIDGMNVSVSVEKNDYLSLSWFGVNDSVKVDKLPEKDSVTVQINVTITIGEIEVTKTVFVTIKSRNVTPIQPEDNFNTDDRYEGYYGTVVDPIQPGGEYDAGDDYNAED